MRIAIYSEHLMCAGVVDLPTSIAQTLDQRRMVLMRCVLLHDDEQRGMFISEYTPVALSVERIRFGSADGWILITKDFNYVDLLLGTVKESLSFT